MTRFPFRKGPRIASMLVAAILFAGLAAPAFAQGRAKDDPLFGPSHRSGMTRAGERQARMADHLGLTDEQRVLFEAMGDALRAYAEASRSAQQERIKSVREEMTTADADPMRIAGALKSKPAEFPTAEYHAMVDASARFYASLGAGQRERLASRRGKEAVGKQGGRDGKRGARRGQGAF